MYRAEAEKCFKTMSAAVDRFPWTQKRMYANYLAQTYHYTSHSVRLLGAMLARTPVEDKGLYDYLVRHIKEENHHEQLALADLRALGHDPGDFEELPACRMLWEPQYYKIEHVGVPAVFGYILMLEMLAVERGPQVAATVSAGHAPARCDRFLKVHGDDDVEHTRRGFDYMETLGREHRQPILRNMVQTAQAYANMLTAIQDEA